MTKFVGSSPQTVNLKQVVARRLGIEEEMVKIDREWGAMSVTVPAGHALRLAKSLSTTRGNENQVSEVDLILSGCSIKAARIHQR